MDRFELDMLFSLLIMLEKEIRPENFGEVQPSEEKCQEYVKMCREVGCIASWISSEKSE